MEKIGATIIGNISSLSRGDCRVVLYCDSILTFKGCLLVLVRVAALSTSGSTGYVRRAPFWVTSGFTDWVAAR